MRFEDALRLAGLQPREVVADGKLRRCATKTHPHRRNGWYLLHLDGRRGVYGDNAVAARQALGHWTDDSTTTYQPTAAELERQQRAREQARKDRIAAIRGARDYWQRSRQCNRLHPYLAAKGLSAFGTAGLRENDGMLVVPVWWNGSLISVQKIHPDGTKRFWPGAPVKAGCVVLERKPCGITAIVEGLATGLAVFQCVRQARVIVAFDAGNLLPVVQAVKPAGSVVLVADNDHGTQAKRGFNPGIEKARNAAELIGAGVAFFDGIEGTDAADALKQWGQQGARRIERLILKEARYVAGTV